MKARVLAVLLALIGALVAALGSAAPASAADELGLSPDGVTWSANLPAPLFDPAFRWVPGDVETASFYVRNQDSEAGVLQVVMESTQVRSLIDTGDLEVAVRVGDSEYAAVTTAGPHTLVQGEQIPAGEVRRIDVRITFEPASSNASQTKQLDLRFGVTLSQDTSVLPPDNGGDGDGDGNGNGVAGPDNNGVLPGTGSTISRGLLLLAVVLTAGGLGLVGIGRRNRDTDERQTSHA
ncbi:hypothetical protein ABIE44_003589 [Marmoricola sp. OAE513]|uniref:hypothetical protein n=1 Tax=Marmoricola sp. OAE513 TaxID=2817894 RepID=UPI001AE9247A